MNENEVMRLQCAIDELRMQIMQLQGNAGGAGGPGAGLFVPIGDFRQGGAATPGVFEPEFDEEGKLSGVRPGLWPYGRDFYATVTVADSAKIDSGRIWIEITHAVSSAYPSARIIGNEEMETTKTKTCLPLYDIANKAIHIDYRCLLALAIRE